MQNIFLTAAGTALTVGGSMADEIINTAVIGFAMVFVILALIWGVLEIFGAVARSSGRKKTNDSKEEPISVPTALPTDGEADDGEIVAAIIAAVSAYNSKPSSSFRVVSFRRSGKN